MSPSRLQTWINYKIYLFYQKQLYFIYVYVISYIQVLFHKKQYCLFFILNLRNSGTIQLRIFSVHLQTVPKESSFFPNIFDSQHDDLIISSNFYYTQARYHIHSFFSVLFCRIKILILYLFASICYFSKKLTKKGGIHLIFSGTAAVRENWKKGLFQVESLSKTW